MRFLLCVLLVLSATSPLAAADKDVFAYAMRPGTTFEGYVGGVMAPARSFLRGMPKGSATLPAFELGLYERASERRWVRAVSAAMRADTDGNGQLDRSELGVAGVQAEKINELFRLFGKSEDTSISRRELSTISEPSVSAARAYLKLANGGKVRLSAIMDRAIRAFKKIDVDGNLEISEAEYQSAFGAAGAAPSQPSPTRDTVAKLLVNLVSDAADIQLPPGSLDCGIPRPSSKAEIVLLGVHGGASLSDVYVGSSEKQTTTAEVAIKAGREPLYIILSAAEPMIWRFTGATNRIERVVLSGPERKRSGAVGIPLRRLALADGDQRDICVPQFHELAPDNARSIADRVAAAIGQKPDLMAASDSVAKLVVTAMDFVDVPASQPPAPAGLDPEQWRAAMQQAPGGIVSIRPGKVAAFAPVGRYKALPQEPGPVASPPSPSAAPTGSQPGKFGLDLRVRRPRQVPGHSCAVPKDADQQPPASPTCL